MNLSTLYKHLLPLAACAVLAACGGGSPGSGVEPPDGELQYNRSAGLLPSPNDLAFVGSQDTTLDGTGSESVNALDGFSTVAPATATASTPIDPSTVQHGSTVRVFEVGTAGDPDTGNPADQAVGSPPVRELTAGTEYVASVSPADQNNRTIAVTPTQPLSSNTTYMVIITNGVEEAGGGPLAASADYTQAKSSNGIIQSHLQAAGNAASNPIPASDIIASWTFTTQGIGNTLAEVDSLAGSASLSVPTVTNVKDTPNGAAKIWAGVLTGVPYYLAAPSGPNDDAPRTKFWEASTLDNTGERNLTAETPQPRERSTVSVPIIVTVPKSGCSPCPVAIFQHGIGTNRKSAIAIADALASMGTPHAVVAIDLPLHGITDTTDPFYAGDENATLQPAYDNRGDIERTFELDLVDNDGSQGPDGEIDPSGEHFVNLASLRTSRDNLRQAVADLLALTNGGLSAIDTAITGAGGTGINASSVDYIGQSLGGIVGTPFLAQGGAGISRAVLAAPGGGVAKLLDGSPEPEISGEIEAGLKAEGLIKGTPAYEQFLGAAQTVIDTGEPLNYAAGAVGSSDLLMFEIVRGNSSPPDQVVPNRLTTPFQQGIPDGTIPSPTAGTEPLATAMGLSGVSSSGGADTIVRFTAGGHSSLVNRKINMSVTTEMQSVVTDFLDDGSYSITDTSLVK